MNLMRGIDLKKIAGKMNGASGAELKVLFSLCPVCLLKSNFFKK
jgi:26S proteasome regulatory subunit T6